MNLNSKKDSALSQISSFCQLGASQIKNLEDFTVFLLKENQRHNLIGKSTIDDLWNRHILDSAQLLKFIDDKNLKFADLGSGAGFPGLVLSILGLKEMHLVEKAFRKADFLRQAKTFSPNKIFVHQAVIEEMPTIEFDCIISRALAPLPKLIGYSNKLLKKDGFCLFLKGRNLPQEIKSAAEEFSFDYELHQSLTSPESNIIKVQNIKK
jgi:16S rRNA (guanine527-N7)-methyltransferase